MTTPAVEELKVRARIARNAAVRVDAAGAPSLGDCLDAAAQAVGFRHWEHARRVLSGLAAAEDDMGAFWHAPGCDALLNLWFARLSDARDALAGRASYLLPFRRQFVVVQGDYIRELVLDPGDARWAAIGSDLVGAYGQPAWAGLCLARLKAPGARFG